MEYNSFETREKAKELIEEAVKIWRQSPLSESLEGLENDPVMSMMMTALAWQAGETENELVHLKEDIVEEFVQALTPYEYGHAIPATAVVEASLKKDIAEWEVDQNSTFKLSGTQYTFLPVLKTRAINAEIKSVTRMDGRRWKVTLAFGTPVQNLSGFTFAIKNTFFNDLKISYKGAHIPLVKPWEYSKLPLTECFSAEGAVYNGSNTFNASMVGMDLFARQNVKLFCVMEHDASQYLHAAEEEMGLVFEFSGITDEFVFDKRQLSINCIVLAEAQLNHASLSVAHPILRVDEPLLHLTRPAGEQLYTENRVEVRRVAADRFNQGRLMHLLATLINKYHTDFYAFQNQEGLASDGTMQTLSDILEHMLSVCRNNLKESAEGVYLLLHHDNTGSKKDLDISVDYLTTHGSATTEALSNEATFAAQSPMTSDVCRQIAQPTPGSDAIGNTLCEESLMRYHIITNDRIVTPADIKAFCRNELLVRYGVDNTMINSIIVSPLLSTDGNGCGYEIATEIRLADNPFIKKSFAGRIHHIELLMQKMMEVRSANIYPIRVSIIIG